MNTSRFITYPSTVEANSNHKIVLVDATKEELVQLERFLQTSQENFDVYVYSGENYDLEWLNYVVSDSKLLLIKDTSYVYVSNNSIRYQTELLDYFEKIELDPAD